MRFFGREQEIASLRDLWHKSVASLVAITGRRRIGKSSLIEEFAKNELFFSFTGMPPTKGVTARSQREAFAKQLSRYFGTAPLCTDWWDLLWFLAEKTREGKVVILLDEISWMGQNDSEFLGVLKTIWDSEFKKNPNSRKALGILSEDILMEGPFFQRSTKAQPGCQIDYMIQMRFGTLYVCEIKFSKDKVSSSVLQEMQEKIDKLKRPKFISCRPVLIHVNGVTAEVEESGYFAKIVSFDELFF